MFGDELMLQTTDYVTCMTVRPSVCHGAEQISHQMSLCLYGLFTSVRVQEVFVMHQFIYGPLAAINHDS